MSAASDTDTDTVDVLAVGADVHADLDDGTGAGAGSAGSPSDDSVLSTTLADVLALEALPLDPHGHIVIASDGTVTFGSPRYHHVPSTAATASTTSTSTTPTVYYVNPLHGSMSNAGTSLDAPWSTFADVMSAGKPLAGGDVLVLLRGYHGAPLVKGVFDSDVVVRAMPGHTPLVRSLTFDAASHWDIGSLVITWAATPAGHPDAASNLRGIDISTQAAENCSYITVRDTSLYTTQDVSARTNQQWQSMITGIRVFATNYALINCHVYNGGGLQLGFHSSMGRVLNCVIENFATDGSGLRASNILFAGNCIYGSHQVNGNHNDLFQCWAARNVVFKNNFLAAYVNPAQPNLAKPGISYCQGVGGYDGWKQDWIIQGNVVKVDHAIGIWQLAVKPNMVFVQNTITRCGKSLAIPGRPPSIHVGKSKSGAASSGAIVANNLCEGYELWSGIVVNASNLKVTPSAFASTFVDWARNDLRLKPGCYAIGHGTSALPAVALPTADALGTPYIDPVTHRVDCGAFAAASTTSTAAWCMTPSAPYDRTVTSVTVVPGVGVDIAWLPQAGDKSFIVQYQGTKIGTVRVGVPTYCWLTANTSVLGAVSPSQFHVTAVSTASY